MRCLSRQSVFCLAIAAHVFAFVLAPAVHFWQISGGLSAGDSVACHACHAGCRQSVPDKSDGNSPPARPAERHDSKHCAICKFFLHAKSPLPVIDSVTQSFACEQLPVPEVCLVFQVRVRAYLSRGPPVG